MESCRREGVWGNSKFCEVAFQVSFLSWVRPTLPSMSHSIFSGVQRIS